MIIFIIPAYNEEENIQLLLQNIDAKMKELDREYQVLLVNDGSKDFTKERALEFKDRIQLEVIDHETNKGVGEVFRSGFSRAMKIASDNDIIVTKEADNTSDIDILNSMFQKISSGYDIVLASCYAPGGKIVGTNLPRLLLSSMANFILKLFFPIQGIHTYSSFYRVYRAGMLRKAFYAYENRLIEDNGFTSMVEMLIKLSRLNVRIVETPMILHSNFRKGKSKMKKLRTVAGYMNLICKELLYKKSKIHDIKTRFEKYKTNDIR